MGCIGHDFFKYLGLVVKDRIKPLLRISVQNLFALRLNLVAACQMATHEKCETLFNKLREMERLVSIVHSPKFNYTMETLIYPCLIYQCIWNLESCHLGHFADIAPFVITKRVVPFTRSWLATVEHPTVLSILVIRRLAFVPVWVPNSASVRPVKVPVSSFVKSNPNVRQCRKISLSQNRPMKLKKKRKEIERAC